MKYIVTAFSMFARPHSYLCHSKEEMRRTKEELQSQQYKVEVEEISDQEAREEFPKEFAE